MPTSIVAMVAGAVVGDLVAGAVGGALLGRALGAVVGSMVSGAINSAFTDAPNQPSSIEAQSAGRMLTIRQAAAPWQWIYGQVRVGGILTYMVTEGTTNEYLYLVITLAGHPSEAISAVYFEDEEVPLDGSGDATGRFAGYVHIEKSLGDEAEGVQPFPSLQTATSTLSSAWSATDNQTGRTKIYVRLKWSEDLFPQGIPNITALVKGRKVYDPRLSPPSSQWSDNASLCTADYLTSAVGVNATYSTEINETQLIAAANISDEQVALAGSPTLYESRYTCNGAFACNETPRTVLSKMLTSMSGSLRYVAGEWWVCPAVYEAPSITLTEDDLRGGIEITPRLSRRELCNGVKGLYVSSESHWQPEDFPPVVNATYLSEDQGERIWHELDLPFTTSSATAQRIAKIELESNRQQIRVQWAGKLSCFQVQVGNTVAVTFEKYGWSSKVFLVEGMTLATEEGPDGTILGVDLSLRETASSVYSWSSGEETIVDPAPDTNLPDPFTVLPPGTPSVTEELYQTRDSRGVQVLVIVHASASLDQHVNRYVFEYKLSSDSEWETIDHVHRIADNGETCHQSIYDVAPGTYDFRIAAINQIGVRSVYSTLSNKEILGLTVAPSDLTGLTLQKLGGIALLKWTRATELDVLLGGRVLTRFSADPSPTWENAMSIGDANGVTGDSVFALLPLLAGTYMLKFEDSTGHQSADATSVYSDGALWIINTVTSTITESPTWAGSFSTTVKDGSTLKLTVYSGDQVASSGSYAFANQMDLGTKQRVRLVVSMLASVVNIADTIDVRSGNIDDWLDFDGTGGGGSGDAYVEVRSTDDAPTGSPSASWSAWNRLDASEQYARAFEFRVQLTSIDPSYNVVVSSLSIQAQKVT